MNILMPTPNEVYQNAVAHGWWDPVPSFGQVIALCHAELSEALEEYRNGRPMVWYACGEDKVEKEICAHYDKLASCDYQVCKNGIKSCLGKYLDTKPEGVAVELVDCLLRIFDYMGYAGWAWQIEPRVFAIADKDDFSQCISELHMDLSNALLAQEVMHETPCVALSCCAGKIIGWLAENYGEGWETLVVKKHHYNKMRSYRHGGKLI